MNRSWFEMVGEENASPVDAALQVSPWMLVKALGGQAAFVKWWQQRDCVALSLP